ncbi:tyrosine-type recombinase/integrase [Magnetococcales bacterium HHB-1]
MRAKKYAGGQKKPFTREQIYIIKNILMQKNNLMELALLMVGLDTMLRSADLLALKVADVEDLHHHIKDTFQVIQKKTKKSIVVALTQPTQQLLKQHILKNRLVYNDDLFSSPNRKSRAALSHPTHTRIVKKWAKFCHLDVTDYSTHSIRKTKASIIFDETRNIEIVRQVLGQRDVAATSAYLGISHTDALQVAKSIIL